jgi:hypothetical protein
MTATTTRGVRVPARPSRGTRRFGYLAAAAINSTLVWLLLVAPGWERLTFLTGDFASLTGVVTASLVAGVTVNLVYVVADPPWLKRLGDATTAAFACVVLARTWARFPFELTGGWSSWTTTLRFVLLFLAIATAVAVLANLGELLRLVVGAAPAQDRVRSRGPGGSSSAGSDHDQPA